MPSAGSRAAAQETNSSTERHIVDAAIPFDPRPPYRASGLRIGLPAATTCGMKEAEVSEVGELMARALRSRADGPTLDDVRHRVAELAGEFPPYPPEFPGHA